MSCPKYGVTYNEAFRWSDCPHPLLPVEFVISHPPIDPVFGDVRL